MWGERASIQRHDAVGRVADYQSAGAAAGNPAAKEVVASALHLAAAAASNPSSP